MAETLVLSSTLSLTIAANTLDIQDNRLNKKISRNSCVPGIVGSAGPCTKKIPLFHILWAEVSGEFKVCSVTFVEEASKTTVKPANLDYPLDKADPIAAEQWVKLLLEKAYGDAQQAKTLKVLINPYGGRGNAKEVWKRDCEPIFRAAHCTLDVEYTTHHQHALEIAQNLDISAYNAVMCVSGDGIPHEVVNGFAKRDDAGEALRKVPICPLPGGSGNGMCWTATGAGTGSMASLIYIKGIMTPIDLVSITQGDRRILSCLSQSFGIVADSDLGTENLRWMGGMRFTWGVFTRIWGKSTYPCDVAYKVVMDDKNAIKEFYRRGGDPHPGEEYSGEGLPPLKFGSVNDPLPEDWTQNSEPNMGNFFAGTVSRVSADAIFFPAVLPSDGMIDVITVDAKIGRVTSLKLMTSADNGSHYDMPCVKYQKVIGYRLVPRAKSGCISIDGESIPFEPFQAEVHRGLGRVLTRNGTYSGGEHLMIP